MAVPWGTVLPPDGGAGLASETAALRAVEAATPALAGVAVTAAVGTDLAAPAPLASEVAASAAALAAAAACRCSLRARCRAAVLPRGAAAAVCAACAAPAPAATCDGPPVVLPPAPAAPSDGPTPLGLVLPPCDEVLPAGRPEVLASRLEPSRLHTAQPCSMSSTSNDITEAW